MRKGVIDEFAYVLFAGIGLMIIMLMAWTGPSEAPPWVEPIDVSLTIKNGTSSTFKLEITGDLTNVTLKPSGEIRTWLSFNKNNFNVVKSTSVTVTVKVPSDASVDEIHTGSIEATSQGGTKSVSITINVQNVTKLQSRSIQLGGDGNIYVSYSFGPTSLDTKQNVEVSKGYFSRKDVNLIGSLSDEKLAIATGGFIQLIVDETNSAGNLVVKFNDKEVYKKRAGPGEIMIPLNLSQIRNSNTVIISAGNPGWRFWMSTIYKFRTATFGVNYKGIFPQNFTFNLSPEEISNFDSLQLSLRTKDYSTPLPEMIIKLNNQIIFAERPPLAFMNRTFATDILGNKLQLKESNNVLLFSFEKEAFYSADSALLTIYSKG